MAAITLENVTKVFAKETSIIGWLQRRDKPKPPDSDEDTPPAEQEGPVRALDGLNLVVPDGITMAVVGPSGCGKSTLLRVVAGLIEYEGAVKYDDRDMQDVPVKERRIGMVFQNYALYPHFYGRGNLRFFFRVNKAPDAEAEARIRVTSEMMGIGFNELLKRKPGTLSGGQQQRVAIARAIVRKPALFLFDEPLSNLDAKLRSQTRVEIKRLLHRFQITAMYVTHDQTEAMALGDQIAVMREGKIEQVGGFREIMANPVNSFVAGFLGLPPMNLIEGKVSGETLRLDDQTVSMPAPIAVATHEGQAVTLGIRPEHATVLDQEAQFSQPGLRLRGTVDVVEPDFGRRQQTAYIHTGKLHYSISVPMTHRLVEGYPVNIGFPEEALYFFDTESEARIRGEETP
jgi:ABC-type sugar transport system ATPase subunit